MSNYIGERIKRSRGKKGISQDRLSKLSDLSLNTIVNIETGINDNPKVNTVKKIAEALGVELNDLIK